MRVQSLDPAAVTAHAVANAYFNNGEFFRSYDLSIDALDKWPAEPAFVHLAVLSLANAGALDLALEKISSLGLAQLHTLEAQTLLARLYKDFGFANSGEERQQSHSKALALYEQTFRQELATGNGEAYYPGINAAALSLWTGDREKARDLAQQVLSLLAELPDTEADRYWRKATEAEAHLLLGDLRSVERASAEVLRVGAGQFAQLATTARQLRRIAEAMALSGPFLVMFAPPAVMHYTGHIIAASGRTGRFLANEEAVVRRQIDALLESQHVETGYGSLAAGADILFAEALLARGAALHVILPFAIPDFIQQSVENSGSSWTARFETCLAGARSVRYATEDAYLNHNALFLYCSQLGMGLALLAAQHMRAPVLQGAVWDGVLGEGIAGTVADLKVWQRTGLPQYILRCGPAEQTADLSKFEPGLQPEDEAGRSIRAMLFGDVHGFSKLNDTELPIFASEIMGPIGEVVRASREHVSFVNTWGDGIFAVFTDVCQAASWALHMQERMRKVDLAAVKLPSHLQLRLGGHLGPAYHLMDPVLERPNYYGAHVSRAARIEPITPEGCVYVTETFAAVLALRGSTEFACDYAGYTEMAKHYGRLRMFLLRRVRGESGPSVLGDIERPPLEVTPHS